MQDENLTYYFLLTHVCVIKDGGGALEAVFVFSIFEPECGASFVMMFCIKKHFRNPEFTLNHKISGQEMFTVVLS